MREFSLLKENEDFVVCKICNFHAQNLGIHLKKIHNLSSEDYIKKYGGQTTSQKSHEKYSENTFRYLTDAKEKGIDLTEYWEKVSNGIKKAITDDPEEIERRSRVMTQVNQSDMMRQKASETAKKTSARPEIQEARSKQLANWRDNNPEDFYNKCIINMLSSWHSVPEKELFNIVSKIEGFNFKYNQIVQSPSFISKTKRKQVDLADKKKQIYIEFDGVLHFEKRFQDPEIFKTIKEKDKSFNDYILNHNYLLIRISYDQFIYSTKMIDKVKHDASYFKQECLDQLIKILNDGIPGIYKIGEAYGKY